MEDLKNESLNNSEEQQGTGCILIPEDANILELPNGDVWYRVTADVHDALTNLFLRLDDKLVCEILDREVNGLSELSLPEKEVMASYIHQFLTERLLKISGI